MNDSPHKYWDSGVFLCFLNKDEDDRRKICEDILEHAENGEFLIYTSYWTMVEVIRPRKQSIPSAEKLTKEQIEKIQAMFDWSWLRKIQVDERVAKKSVELSRVYGLHPADAVHAASAIITPGVNILQKWDRDFSKVSHLIRVEDPKYITDQPILIEGAKKKLVGPHIDDFKPATITSPDPPQATTSNVDQPELKTPEKKDEKYEKTETKDKAGIAEGKEETK